MKLSSKVRAWLNVELLESRLAPALFNVSSIGTLLANLSVADGNADASNTIVLAPGTYTLAGATASDILIKNTTALNKILTIQGGTDANTIITGGAGWTTRIFEITGGTNLTVKLENLTITGGDVKGNNPTVTAQGGGLLIDSGNVALSNVAVTGNKADGAAGSGGEAGAAGKDGGDGGNGAGAQGGGIYLAAGALTLVNATINGNSATGGDGGDGGEAGANPPQGRAGSAGKNGRVSGQPGGSSQISKLGVPGRNGKTGTAGKSGGDPGGSGGRGGNGSNGANGAGLTGTIPQDNGNWGGRGGNGGNGGNGAGGADAAKGGKGGDGGDADGGGLYVASGTLTIVSVMLNNNTATGGKGGKGADGAEGGAGGKGGEGGNAGNGGAGADGGVGAVRVSGAYSVTFYGRGGPGGWGGSGGAGGDGGAGGAGGDGGDGGDGGAAKGGGVYVAAGSVTLVQTTLNADSATGGTGGDGGKGGDGGEGGEGGNGGEPGNGGSGGKSGNGMQSRTGGAGGDAFRAANGGSGGKGGGGGDGGDAGNGGDGQGGAIYLAGGSVDILLSTLSNGSAQAGNGGDGGDGGDGGKGGDGGEGGNGGKGGAGYGAAFTRYTHSGKSFTYSGGNNGGYGANGGKGGAGDDGGGAGKAGNGGNGAGGAVYIAAGALSLNTSSASGTAQGGNAGKAGAVGSGGTGGMGGQAGNGGIGGAGAGAPQNGAAGDDGDTGTDGATSTPGLGGTSVGNTTFGTPTSDTTPPTINLNAANVTNADAPNPYTFTIAYSDPSFVNESTVPGAVVQVQPPSGPAITATAISTAYSTPQDSNSDAETITVTYQFTPPGGDWNDAPTGAYTIKLISNPPQDLAGNAALTGPIGTFNNDTATLTVSANTLDLGTTTVGTASAQQSYTVSGSNLTAPITITAPIGVELSDNNGATFHAALTLNPTAGTVSNTTIKARISATAVVGAIDADITNASTGADTQDVAVTGTITGPTVTLSTTTLGLGTTNARVAGSTQSYTVGGGNLRAPILITAPTGVELSADGGTTFHTSLTLTPAAGNVATTMILVRISAAAGAGAIGGNITNASTAAVTGDVAVSGTVNVSQNENGLPAPITVKAVLGSNYSDPDGAANTKPGIAIIGLAGSGVWQFATNGVAWTTIAAASQASALLLPSADSLRFVPTTNWSGQAELQYLAWDGSQGTAGKTFDASATGGATPFSSAVGTLVVTVNPVPIWVGAGAHLVSISPGNYTTTPPAGNTIASVFGPYFQDNNGSVSVGVAIESVAGTADGAWQFMTGAGIWTNFPALSATAALLLSANDQIRFVPRTNFAGVVSLSALPWDGSAGADGMTGNPAKLSTSAFGTTKLTATAAVNQAPTLSGAPITGTPVPENANGPAVLVSTLLSQAGYADPDGTSLAQGIAIVGTNSSVGNYQYMLPGGAWQALPSVLASAALLLPSTASLRFVSGADLGMAALTFLGWDQTEGIAGQTFDTTGNGGATAFSTATSTLSIAVEEAPSWSASAGADLTPLAPTRYRTNNPTTPAGNTISSVFGNFFQDVNPSVTTVGVAVVGMTGNGTWQYATTAGDWLPFTPTPSKTAALLLSAGDFIRFVPAVTTAAVGTLTAYAWDGGGTAGPTVNLTKTGVGGTTDYSATTITALAAANTAPTINNAITINGATVLANTTGPALTVSGLLSQTGYSDPDGRGLPEGIAIVSTASNVSNYQYMLPGGTWQMVPSVSVSAALLLPSNASLRLMAGAQLGPATLMFGGWDQTQGAAGQLFDTTSNNSASAFSTNSGTLSIAVKQAPSWSAATGASLTPLLPAAYSIDDPTPAGNTVNSVFGSFFQDANVSPTVGIAVVGLAGNGTWQYMPSTGTTWLDFAPAPSKTAALLLSANDLIRFVPRSNVAGTATLTAYAWDGSTGTDAKPINLTQTGVGGITAFSATAMTANCIVNTAPTLANNSSVTLAAVKENATGAAVTAVTAAALLKDADYRDADGTSVPSGIAISADTGPGTWQWLDGSIWTPVPNIPANYAFLLPSSADVRFLPTNDLPSNTSGSASLTYLAWDQTAGIVDATKMIGAGGGTSAYSSTAATATLAVDFVKQAPTWIAGASASLTPVVGFSASNPAPNPAGDTVASIFGNAFDDAPGISVGVAITALSGTSDGAWQYSTDGGSAWTNFPAVSMTNSLLLTATDLIRFVPSKSFSGTVSLAAYAWDGTGTFADNIANLTKTGTGGDTAFSATMVTATCLVNTAPTLT